MVVTGAELSLMNPGFLPGDTVGERVAALTGTTDPGRRAALVAEAAERVDAFLATAVARVRDVFGGPVSYAAVPLERVDWSRFDIVGLDLYRSAEVADRYAEGVRSLVAAGKPVAITEFGSCAYAGAGDRGALAMEITVPDPADPAGVRLDGVYPRDEPGQAAYLRELLEIFDAEGVDTAFVFLFALHSHPHRPDGDPRHDLDLISPGVVKVLEGRTGTRYPGLPWEPKEAFDAVAAHYRASPTSAGELSP